MQSADRPPESGAAARDERAEPPGESASGSSDLPALLLEIGVGDRRLAIPIAQVEAVVLTPPITPVPGTPPDLAGLFNHHGVVYPAVHPFAGLAHPGRQSVLLRTTGHGRMAVLCEWVHDLVESSSAEPLDVDALAARVVAAYAGLDASLPDAASPRAVARLRRTRKTGEPEGPPVGDPPERAD